MNADTAKFKSLVRLANHRTFAVFLLTIVLMEVAHGIELIKLFPLYLQNVLGEGAGMIGLTLSTYLIADILVRTPAGWGADKWARKPLLIIGVLCSALAVLISIMISISTNFYIAAACYAAVAVVNTGPGVNCPMAIPTEAESAIERSFGSCRQPR